jgi:hypothetical protein
MASFQQAYWLARQIRYFMKHPGEAALFVIIPFLSMLVFKVAWWHIKKPLRLVSTTVVVAAMWQWGWNWKVGVAAQTSVLAVLTLAWVALTAERGTARGLSAILTGVYRLVRIRKLWPSMCIATKFTDHEGFPLPARDWRITQHGLMATVAFGAAGRPEFEALAFADAIRSNLYVARVRLKRLAPGLVNIFIEWGDHLKEIKRLSEIPPATREGYLSVGIREDGRPFELPIGKSVLAVGLTGSGKSSFAWALVYALIRAGIPFRLTICNPKYVEWKIAKESIEESPIVYRYTDSPADLGERGLRKDGFMWVIAEEMTAKLQKIPVGQRYHVPTDEEPLDIIIVDETLPLVDQLRKKKEQHPLGLVTYQGRAAGSWVIFLSQTGEKDVIGPVRDLVPIRLAFALPNREQTEMSLGTGAVNKGAMPHFLDPTEDSGVCYFRDDEGDYGAARIGFATDTQLPYLIMGHLPPEDSGEELDKYNWGRPCYVYEYYGFDDFGEKELKYIGEAYDWEERYKQHCRNEPEMMAEVVKDWTEVVLYPTKASAEIEEARRIRSKHPKWNKQHNADHYRGKVNA